MSVGLCWSVVVPSPSFDRTGSIPCRKCCRRLGGRDAEERQRHEDKSCLALEKLDEEDEGCECDECGVEIPIGVVRLTCEFCECDLCEACVATR
jgi:hypothetical protein